MASRQRGKRELEDDRRVAEARRALEAVERDAETLGASSLARTANRARDHFAGTDDPADDRIEIWGKRIGRGLGLIAVIALAIHLVVTYVLK